MQGVNSDSSVAGKPCPDSQSGLCVPCLPLEHLYPLPQSTTLSSLGLPVSLSLQAPSHREAKTCILKCRYTSLEP